MDCHPTVPQEKAIHSVGDRPNPRAVAPRIKDNLDDLDNCEWMAPINWEKVVSREQAYFERKAGLFAPRIVRASLAQQPKTVKFIEKKFEILDLFAFTDAALA
jgi:hypothetical protein